MPDTLHITNGDGAADIIEICGVDGDVLPWRDPMHHGPFLPGLSLEQLSRVRIAYLEGDLNTPHESASSVGVHGFTERDSVLESAYKYDEVVLWFEHDLLDQLQILQLLDWFALATPLECKLSLICINQFDGIPNFRGIGQLVPEQMATLYAKRQPITSAQLQSAQTYWAAFCASEPQTLLKLVKANSTKNESVTPFTVAALMRHCQEFPWTADGLTLTERQLLKLVASGVTRPQQVFLNNMDFESYLYIGDWRTYSQIAELCESQNPLMACESGKRFVHPNNPSVSTDAFAEQRLCITPLGKRVLGGDALNGADTLTRDRWLGGVHLRTGAQLWFWNEQTQTFTYS